MSRVLPYLAVVLSVLAAGCSRVAPDGGQKVDVLFSGACGVTKGAADGADMASLDVLVFRQDGGALECHSRAAGRSVTCVVTAGVPVTYYVVADVPDGTFDAVSEEGRFTSLFWGLDVFSSGTAMTGGGSGVFDGTVSVDVPVDRLVSRVVLEKVTPSFLDHSYIGAVVKLERVFLVNVNGGCPYSGGPKVSDVWYNRMQPEPAGSVGGYLESVHGNVLKGAAPVVLDDVLYCCPNPVDNGVTSADTPVWSVRNTRLVIELSIDGVPNYYPVTLPAMLCNHSYVVKDAVLTGPGSSHPDVPVDRTSMSVSVQVNPWGVDDGHVIDF